MLWVGCAPYTKAYEALFGAAEYWTLDKRPSARPCGAARHVVARLEDLARRAPPEHFDVILCNGVLGWGLDAAAPIERAFDACHRALRPGGHLLLGWNDVWPRDRVPPDRIAALTRFERAVFVPLQASRMRTAAANRHIYEFFVKPGADTTA